MYKIFFQYLIIILVPFTFIGCEVENELNLSGCYYNLDYSNEYGEIYINDTNLYFQNMSLSSYGPLNYKTVDSNLSIYYIDELIVTLKIKSFNNDSIIVESSDKIEETWTKLPNLVNYADKLNSGIFSRDTVDFLYKKRYFKYMEDN